MRLRRSSALCAALALAFGGSAGRAAQPCTAHLTETPAPGPRALSFGVTAAGQVFSNVRERVPDDPPRTLAALAALRGDAPSFLVRLNRFFFKAGEDGIDAFEAVAARYTAAGHQVSLQLRYGPFQHPVEPDPDAFAAWVRRVVERLGDDPGVVAVEVTNEPNLATAPDNSDGAHPNVIAALTRGVVAAATERDARGYTHMTVGFNWFHDTGPVDENAFWSAVAAEGGAGFAGALDWVGLNAYPGTYDFLATPPGLEGREMLTALTKLRRCYLPMIGAGGSIPIRVIENGFPDGFRRPESLMADTLERMLRAVAEHAATFNVTHYLWFDLRDASSPNLTFETHYGLLKDDYTPKEAFGRYASLVSSLG